MDSEEDLELLLSLQSGDVVPESPRPSPSGYHSDEDLPRSKSGVSMAAFKDVVAASLETPMNIKVNMPSKQATAGSCNGVEIEKNSGLRIKRRLVSCAGLSSRLLELRFVRLEAMRNATMGEKTMGAWATIGVLTEKSNPKMSSNGKNFAIWKLSSLGTSTVSLLIFGEAYNQHWKESAGSIVSVFNAKVRHDEKRNELSLSVFSSDQIQILGASVDYGICRGVRKDGVPCNAFINRRHGEYCKYHTSAVRKKYTTKRAELAGGNLGTGFADPHKYRSAQVAKTFVEDISDTKPMKRSKHMTKEDLQKVLCNADKVTTKHQSQGIRFLACLAENAENIDPRTGIKKLPSNHNRESLEKRTNLGKTITMDAKPENVCNRKPIASRNSAVIELDLDGPDDAMVQAMSFFQEGHGKFC